MPRTGARQSCSPRKRLGRQRPTIKVNGDAHQSHEKRFSHRSQQELGDFNLFTGYFLCFTRPGPITTRCVRSPLSHLISFIFQPKPVACAFFFLRPMQIITPRKVRGEKKRRQPCIICGNNYKLKGDSVPK